MKDRRLKVRDKIFFYIIPIIFVTLIMIVLLGHSMLKQILSRNFNDQKNQVSSHVTNAVSLIDAGFRMLSKSLESEMEKGIQAFKSAYESAGGDPEKVSLESIKTGMGGKYDLIIIDSSTTIIKSTLPEGLNFNFMAFDKALGEKIQAIRLSDVISHEAIRTNVGTGLLSKFAYMATADHQYVLEIAYSKGGLGTVVSELDPLKITQDLVYSNPIVKSIRIFDAYGYEFVNSGEAPPPDEAFLKIIEKVKADGRFDHEDGETIKSYLYIHLMRDPQVLSDNSKIIEIVFDTSAYMDSLNSVSFILFFAGFVLTALILVVIFILSKRLTRPLTLLGNAAREISKGNYDVVAEVTSQDEIGELADVFNTMTAKIKENFKRIEMHQEMLSDYSKNLEKKVDERTQELLLAKETIKNEKAILERILDDTLSGYWDWDLAANTIYFSMGFKRMLGYEAHEMPNSWSFVEKLLFAEDQEKVKENLAKHVESRGRLPFFNEIRFSHKDGSTRWAILTGHVAEWSDDHQPLQMIGCQIDITSIKMLGKSLKEERELLKATLLSIGDGVITTDQAGKVHIINAVAEKLTGWTQSEVYKKDFCDLFCFSQSMTGECHQNLIADVLGLEAGSLSNSLYTLVSRDGRHSPVEISASAIKDENGHSSGVVLILRDFSEKLEKQQWIEYLSLHDQLTGLYNRRFLEEELLRLDGGHNLPLSIILLDVNGLKLINDAFGHAMGDKALKRAAEIIKGEIPDDGVVSRFGGDEFVILLPNTTGDEAEKRMKRIYASFEDEVIASFSISVSCGWAVKETPEEDIKTVFKLAEDRMYRRKLSESKSMHSKTIDIIIRTLHGKSEREKKHSERVSQLCEAIGAAMGFKEEDIKEFGTIGLVHDIGKIAIDLRILDKPGKLNPQERAEIERHPELGYQILRSIHEFAKIAEFVLSHHERWDGSGYPRRLKGEDIPLEARMIAVADAYDAMTSDRAYRKALSSETAIGEIMRNAGTQFDPRIARVFVEEVLGKPWSADG